MHDTISINQLKPGMFVVQVSKQSGSVKIKNQGWVKTQTAIDKLKKVGVQEVIIDPDKTLQRKKPSKEAQPKPTATESAKPQSSDPWASSVSVESELNKAQRLYSEAKQLQSKAFKDIKAGRKIDVGPFKDVAKGFMDSVFRNQDALACLTRLREKDAYLMEHSINVSILMTIFAKHLRLDTDTIHELATGALLHDIGKIKIPDEILHKPGRLTEQEFAVIKDHARFSKEILEQSGLTGIAVDIAGFHHERIDGTGYPFGKKAEEISQYVRMASIVDVYDALTAERVYKEGMTPIQAFKILKDGVPNHFDGELLNRFIQCIGVHPVGTLVKLTNHKVGVVSRSNPNDPLKPQVKTFYNAKHAHYTQVEDIDLTRARANEELEAAVKPELFNIDLMRFFKHSLMP
ncbi:HD-GYP domain-containing protein [Pseudoalteromonas sp. Cnat2-41]|uniref:HD-GYP domain-containing protein n=1 Tax=unclassified Pseudoalteromonas TaxID=194690 RepID=UPI001EF8D95D|nr:MULTISPECIES: HD-GYP domain-containing protein [unclassified Pseudoalteromonas]MCF2862781.1 HD-GYP domain-containing protein [Pseudoalteromonas sp. CNAT2-18]MCG7558767.1 HD-GYP domain-containing protein [Pseudoalteromonas sp. CNAT2-18.1]